MIERGREVAEGGREPLDDHRGLVRYLSGARLHNISGPKGIVEGPASLCTSSSLPPESWMKFRDLPHYSGTDNTQQLLSLAHLLFSVFVAVQERRRLRSAYLARQPHGYQ